MAQRNAIARSATPYARAPKAITRCLLTREIIVNPSQELEEFRGDRQTSLRDSRASGNGIACSTTDSYRSTGAAGNIPQTPTPHASPPPSPFATAARTGQGLPPVIRNSGSSAFRSPGTLPARSIYVSETIRTSSKWSASACFFAEDLITLTIRRG